MIQVSEETRITASSSRDVARESKLLLCFVVLWII